MENFNFELSAKMVDDLQTYSAILEKDVSTILQEALSEYFERTQEKLEASSALGADHTMTNLDYDEFWDDVDID